MVYQLGEESWLHLHVFPDDNRARVGADGLRHDISDAITEWMAPPLFHPCGRVIALCLGANEGEEEVRQRCDLIADSPAD